MNSGADQQKEAFQQALQKKYTACIFDIDGTLTVLGDKSIPADLQPRLADFSMSVPMAVCTARRLQSALDILVPVFGHAVNPLYCQANWMLICENGAIGYVFDPEKKSYVEIYRAKYPYPEAMRENLFGHLNFILKDRLGLSFKNVVSLVFRPPQEGVSSDDIQKHCREITKIIQQELIPYDPKGLLAVGDSGLGVSIFPANSNKEQGILEFAKCIAAKHGYKISPEAREIIAVGDQPGPLGNDEGFLKGIYGTSFTVGNTHPENLLPLPVFDNKGSILKGPEATLFLLGQLSFRDGLGFKKT